MTEKRKFSRKEREAAREEAIQRTDELAALVQELRQNDEIGSHFSLWLDLTYRVDWWPGSRHWRDHEGKDHFGETDEFFQFIAAQ